MSDTSISVIRTVVPYLVGALVTWLASQGLAVSDSDKTVLALAMTFLLGSVYYIIVRLLEKKWPQLGWLLGQPKAPSYGG